MINKHMPVFAKKIKNMQDFNDFMEKFAKINRTLYFSNSDEPPRYFKGLTSFFKDRLEFGFVTRDAYEVQEYLNQTTSPRWVVLKSDGLVHFEKRLYLGKRNFADLKDYLSVFAQPKPLDRRKANYKKPLRERMSHLEYRLIASEINYGDIRASIDFPDEIVILHVIDSLAMDYPNLVILQKNYGNLIRVVEFNANDIAKKVILRDLFPNQKKKPFIVVYPYGDRDYKVRNKRVFAGWDTVDSLMLHISDLIGDHSEKVDQFILPAKLPTAFQAGKGVMVLMHDHDKHSSMSFRILARNKTYTDRFVFLTFKKPSAEYLESAGISKLPTIVFMRPELDDLYTSEDYGQIMTVEFMGQFKYEDMKGFMNDMYKKHIAFIRAVREVRGMKDFEAVVQSRRRENSVKIRGEEYGEKRLLFLVDKKKDIANEDWEERMVAMKVVRKYFVDSVGSIRAVLNTAFVDINCFGPILEEAFRFKLGKDVPVILLFRPLVGGRPGEGLFLRDLNRLSKYNGKDFVNRVADLEKLGSIEKLGYIKTRVNLWNNLCLSAGKKNGDDL